MHSFLTTTVDGGYRSDSDTEIFILWESAPGLQRIGGWVGPTPGTHKNFLPLTEIEATSLCHPTWSLVPTPLTAPFTKYSRDQTGISVVAVCSTQGGHDKIATVG